MRSSRQHQPRRLDLRFMQHRLYDTVPASLDELLTLHDARFVRAAYLGLLGRPADAAGLKSYVDLLARGVPREQLIVALAESDEGRRNPSPLPGMTAFVEMHRPRRTSLPQRFLGRLGRMLNHSQEAPLRARANNLAALSDRFEAERADWRGRVLDARQADAQGPAQLPHAQTIAELEAIADRGAASAATTSALMRLATALRQSRAIS